MLVALLQLISAIALSHFIRADPRLIDTYLHPVLPDPRSVTYVLVGGSAPINIHGDQAERTLFCIILIQINLTLPSFPSVAFPSLLSEI